MNYTVLVVDDDEEDFMLLDNHVQVCHPHITLTYVPNGEEAIRKLQEEETPTLIILDAQMPLMGGYETVKVIRESVDWKHIPILIWSGTLMEADIVRYHQAGANSVILKHSVFDQIDVFCHYWLELVELPIIH